MKQRWWISGLTFAAGAAFGTAMTLVVSLGWSQDQPQYGGRSISQIWPPTTARAAAAAASAAPSARTAPESDLMYFPVIEPPNPSRPATDQASAFGWRAYSKYGPYILGTGPASQPSAILRP